MTSDRPVAPTGSSDSEALALVSVDDLSPALRFVCVPARLPGDEDARVAALHARRVLDTDAEEIFDSLTKIAADVCDTPIALISLVDTDRQWFKSRVGLDASETPRDMAFCSHAILASDPMIVPDALDDERFARNPLVMGDPSIRFYAGVPLIGRDGHALGTLCVIDRRPRQLDERQVDVLRGLARQASRHLDMAEVTAALAAALDAKGTAEEALRFAATHDHLTGLLNRAAFMEALEVALIAGSNPSIAYLDLDGFKQVNDSHGHHVGDALLKVVASQLLEAVRTDDIVARLGGDEFAVLVPGPHDTDPDLVGRIRSAISRPIEVMGVPICLGVSIGVAGAAGGDGPDELLRRADGEMYADKRANRAPDRPMPSAAP